MTDFINNLSNGELIILSAALGSVWSSVCQLLGSYLASLLTTKEVQS